MTSDEGKFTVEEYKMINERLMFIRRDMANFEIVVFAALAAFYSWAFSFEFRNHETLIAAFLIPVFISTYAALRYHARVTTARRYSYYVRCIEAKFYDGRRYGADDDHSPADIRSSLWHKKDSISSPLGYENLYAFIETRGLLNKTRFSSHYALLVATILTLALAIGFPSYLFGISTH